jgi:hypothetical protein
VRKRYLAVVVIVAVLGALWIVYSAGSPATKNVSSTSALACPTVKDLNPEYKTYLTQDPTTKAQTIYLNISLTNTLHNQITITSVDVSLLNFTFPNGTVVPANQAVSSGEHRILLNHGEWTSLSFTIPIDTKITSANFGFLIHVQGCHDIAVVFTADLP